VVNTGHLSPAEALAVIAAARDAGVDRIIVTHAQFEVVNMSLEDMKKAAGMGAKMELCAAGPLMVTTPSAMDARLEACANTGELEAIRSIGTKHFVLGTDSGKPAIRRTPMVCKCSSANSSPPVSPKKKSS